MTEGDPARGPTWHSPDRPAPVPVSFAGWLRVGLRGLALVPVLGGGLVLLLLMRLVERPLCGLRRPVTPWVTVLVCRLVLATLGIRRRIVGQPARGPGAVVANHASWLDIFALNAVRPVLFVAKAEVAGWAGIGWLARATGTVFIRRDRTQAAAQLALFRERLAAGHRLVVFPEGTSTDGLRVLPFKATLFAAFDAVTVQPVSILWTSPPGYDARFYGWWGDMDFGGHALKVLAARRQGQVTLHFHAVPPAGLDRKTLAQQAEASVRLPFQR